MGTWVLNGTTVKLADNANTVAIGADTTTPDRKLEVVGGPARLAVEDRGGEVYDVRAYGARGDGGDDTLAVNGAIQAAQAAPRGGIVYFPPGTYRITAALLLPSELLTVTRPLQFLGAGPKLSVITTDDPTRNIFQLAVPVPDNNDKVEPVIFRDLKFEAMVPRTAGAAIRQDVPPGSFFQHGIRIGNCHFKGQYIAVELHGASTAVIENNTFWQGIASEADVWIDEQAGIDSTTHLITGCLFGDSTRTAAKAIKITGKSGGDRIIGNLFVYYETQIHFEVAAGTAQLIQGNVMEGARTAAIRMTGSDNQIHSVISGNTIRIGPLDTPLRCIWADVSGPGAVASRITVVGNKLASDLTAGTTKGIELAPTGGATVDHWLIAENLLEGFTVAVDAGPGVTGLMLGNNAYNGNAADFANASGGAIGAAFLDRVGIGAPNVMSPTKDLRLKSALAVRPRIYLEGLAGVSSPGVEFAFDGANTRRAALVGAAAGSSGVQLELFTKPDGAGPAQRLVVDKDGNALWTSPGFQEMVSVPVDPPAPTAGRGRLYMRDTGTGKTQLCVRFATGPAQVIASEP